MSVLRINKHFIPQLTKCRLFATLPESEYTATPQYPEIQDLSFDKKVERKEAVIHEEIKKVKTVEEKQIKLNMPRYYGFKCYLLQEDNVPYNNLGLTQHVTRTHLIKNTLPQYYPSVDDEIATSLKTSVEEAVAFELDGYRKIFDIKKENLDASEKEKIVTSGIVRQINRAIVNALSKKCPHLTETQVDLDSRIESIWYAGGMEAPLHVKKAVLGVEWQKELKLHEKPVDRIMNYLGSAYLKLRHSKPLKPLIPYVDCEAPEYDVPAFKFDPRTVGIATKQRHLANIPGHWPGDPNKFSIVSYHSRAHMTQRQRFNDPKDDEEAIHRQGILASFAWLNCQANYLGFTTFNDITFPLVTQTIITDGKRWSFYAYQLNTILFTGKNAFDNPKKNICWATPEMNLFEEVKDGKLVGFNDEVLRNLIKFYSNVPNTRLGLNMTPYLSQEAKVSADYEDAEKREWLEREYKHLMANNPRYKLDPEIYQWEKIYKIDNNTRAMEPRRRFFELKQNPYKRPLNERKPFYVPRALRPHLPKYKGRDAKEFFP